MHQSPGLKAGCLSKGRLPCPSFCGSNANPRPPHRRCGALKEDQSNNHSCIIGPNQGVRACCCHGGWEFEYQNPDMLCQPLEGRLCEWQQKIPPSSNEWFWQMPTLFPVLRYISNVDIDILKGNSLKIGV